MRFFLLICILCYAADSVAQVADCTINRRGLAESMREVEIGIIDHFSDSFANQDPGDLSFTARLEFGVVNSLAGQSVNWNASVDSLSASGDLWVQGDKSAEPFPRIVTAATDVSWTFGTADVSEVSYRAIVTGQTGHVFRIWPIDGGASYFYYDLSYEEGDVSVDLPDLPAGQWELMVSILESEEESTGITFSATCEFEVCVRPSGLVSLERENWGGVKALFR